MPDVLRLSQSEACNLILHRQGLIQRYKDPLEAARAMIAIQTQYPASVGPALAARAVGVTDRWLNKALAKDRTLLKGWSVRFTLHAHTVEDHMLLVAAMWTPHTARFARGMQKRLTSAGENLEDLNQKVLSALAKGPLDRRALHDRIPFYKTMDMVGWGLDVMGLSVEGKVVLSRQAAANTEFALVSQWAPSAKPCPLSEDLALQELMRRYFAGYGPATFSDFVYWSGLLASGAKKAFAALEPELQPIVVEGLKGTRYVHGLKGIDTTDLKAPSVRLLPKFDVLLMGLRDKTLFLEDRLKPLVFRKAGQVEAVILVRGRVRGTWRTQRKGNSLEFSIEPYAKLGDGIRKAIGTEARKTAASLGFREFSLVFKA